MALRMIDFNGHEVVDANGAALTAGANGTTAPGTIVPVNAGLGAGSAVAVVAANDRSGSFNATAAGTPAAGVIASVFFAQPYAQVPRAIIVTAINTTDGTASVTVGAASVTVTGFNVVSTVPVAAKTYLIQYVIVP